MQFDDTDTSQVKDWVVKRLEDISDADADVLADYVIALVKSEEEESQVRANCLENLEDFLREHTQKFVDDIFTAIRTKSYKPGQAEASLPAAIAAKGVNGSAAPFNPPTGPAALQSQQQQQQQHGGQSRKRGFHEREGNDSADPHYGRSSGGERAVKQMRRGGSVGSGQNAPRGRSNLPLSNPMTGPLGTFGMPQNMSPMPSVPPGFPPLDPNDPMSAIMAMQAMGFPPMPGFPFPGSPDAFSGFQQPPPQKKGERCKDYDTKGFCAKGSMCPYDHGSDHLVVSSNSEEYDPSQSSLISKDTKDKDSPRPTRGGPNSRGRGRGRGHGHGHGASGSGSRANQRAAFSSSAPNFDRNNTSIVIEQIPEDKFNEAAVRDFFAEFGEIDTVNMQPYKRLAVVKFRDYNAARSAYDSPKVIFDNRFVKVYWYKPDAVLPNTAAATTGKSGDELAHGDQKVEDEEMIDPEEFEKKQAEAQKAHEEKMKKLEEARQAKEELDKRIKAQAEERKRLLEKLAAKTGGTSQSATSSNPHGPNGATSTSNADSQSPAPISKTSSSAAEALRTKLAELEAEAETLGLGPDEAISLDGMSSYPSYRGGRGRGARGFNRGRGRGRGSWRGFGAPAGGAVARLDNRPKSVRVVPTEEQINFNDTSADEALRAHLFSVGEFSSITPASTNSDESKSDERADCAIVAFHQRYIAEMLISSISPPSGNGSIPGLGKVRFEWVANPPPTSSAATVAPSANNAAKETPKSFHDGANAHDQEGHDHSNVGSSDMNGAGAELNGQHQHNHHATAASMVDFDVAEDDEDRWMR